MRGIFSFRTWLVVSLLWAAAMAYLCYASWPRVPLDISAIDPATVEALRAMILKHVGFYGLVSAVPPLLVLGLCRRMCARR
jgi:hypothetical protein